MNSFQTLDSLGLVDLDYFVLNSLTNGSVVANYSFGFLTTSPKEFDKKGIFEKLTNGSSEFFKVEEAEVKQNKRVKQIVAQDGQKMETLENVSASTYVMNWKKEMLALTALILPLLL